MSKLLLIVQGDTNDGDYVSNESIFHSREHLKATRDALEKLLSFEDLEWNTSHYASDDEDPETVFKGKLTREEMNLIENVVPYGEHGIHSLSSIEIHEVLETETLL